MEFLRVSLRFLRRPAIGGARQARLGQCFQHFRFRHIQWDPLCVPLDGRVWKSAEDIPSAPAVSSIVLCVSESKVVAGMCVGIKKTLRNYQKPQPRTPLGQSLTLFDLVFFRWNSEVTALLSGFPWRCELSQRNPRSANTWAIFSYGSSSGGGQGRIDTKQH